jgi:hypothetical protein
MSKLNIFKQAVHNYTLITPTLAVWSALFMTIIAVADVSVPVKWLLSVLSAILVIVTVICAKRWSRLFDVYHKILLREKAKMSSIESDSRDKLGSLS